MQTARCTRIYWAALWKLWSHRKNVHGCLRSCWRVHLRAFVVLSNLQQNNNSETLKTSDIWHLKYCIVVFVWAVCVYWCITYHSTSTTTTHIGDSHLRVQVDLIWAHTTKHIHNVNQHHHCIRIATAPKCSHVYPMLLTLNNLEAYYLNA